MAARDLQTGIAERLARVGLTVTAPLASALASYLALLGEWNRTINLTALDVATPSDAALDRLIVEPWLAARHVPPEARVLIDVGSGGGSPGIPLALALPALRVVLVESKARKSAFLREVARRLDLPRVEVETCRAEDLAATSGWQAVADVVSVRAVRLDRPALQTIARLLRPHGRVLSFGASAIGDGLQELGLSVESEESLAAGSHLTVLVRG